MHTRTLAFIFRPIDLARAWRRWLAAWRRFAAAPAHERPDAATLRDLGLHTSEWDSLQAEAAGLAAPTRRRVVPRQ